MKNNKIAELLQQEQELVFRTFTSDDALSIGLMLIERAKQQGICYAIHISLNKRELFHFSVEGAPPDWDRWTRRKENTVYNFFASSYRVTLELTERQESLCPRYGLSDYDYVLSGGSFPITIQGVGVVGAITLSGMPEEEDHQCIVTTLSSYLSSKESIE